MFLPMVFTFLFGIFLIVYGLAMLRKNKLGFVILFIGLVLFICALYLFWPKPVDVIM